jgi:hypothetical protein
MKHRFLFKLAVLSQGHPLKSQEGHNGHNISALPRLPVGH